MDTTMFRLFQFYSSAIKTGYSNTTGYNNTDFNSIVVRLRLITRTPEIQECSTFQFYSSAIKTGAQNPLRRLPICISIL